MESHSESMAYFLGVPFGVPLSQMDFEPILHEAPRISEISSDGQEIEQKYVFARTDCQESHRAMEKEVEEFFKGKSPAVREFDGTDYYFKVRRRGKLYAFRYRIGFPVTNRLGVKVKEKKTLVRKEVEFHTKAETRGGTKGETENPQILEFLRVIASLGDSKSVEEQIHVKGKIRVLHIARHRHQKIEVVISVSTDELTGQSVSLGEIEAHGYESHTEALQTIRKFEKALGWKKFRSKLSMSELWRK